MGEVSLYGWFPALQVLLHSNGNIFSFLVRSSLVKLEISCTVSLLLTIFKSWNCLPRIRLSNKFSIFTHTHTGLYQMCFPLQVWTHQALIFLYSRASQPTQLQSGYTSLKLPTKHRIFWCLGLPKGSPSGLPILDNSYSRRLPRVVQNRSHKILASFWAIPGLKSLAKRSGDNYLPKTHWRLAVGTMLRYFRNAPTWSRTFLE